MFIRALKYFYHYGIWNLLGRIKEGAQYIPKGVGFFYFRKYGVSKTSWRGSGLLRNKMDRIALEASEIKVVATFLWGGGATSYVLRLIADACEDALIILCSPTEMAGVLSCTCWMNGIQRLHFFSKGMTFLGAECLNKKVTVVINELVTWEVFAGKSQMTVEAIAHVVKEFVDVRKRIDCQLCYLVHDYYSVCPRWNLVDDEWYYCSSEYTLTKCRDCLKKDSANYRYQGGLDIRGWRDVYKELFKVVDEVRCFSEDTRERMRWIYPMAKLTVVPHQQAGMPLRVPTLSTKGIVIGVFGVSLKIKGSGKVDELEAYLRKIGRADVKIARVTKYQRADMPDIVEREGINVAFFSSVCPETFSYVTQELIAMRLPVVCYNLGAPAERVSKYDKGMVIPDMTPEATWKAIEELARKEKYEYAS